MNEAYALVSVELVNLSRDGDRKSRGSFDQGKPADCGGAGNWLEGDGVNSLVQGRLAGRVNDRGFAPETRVKGGVALDEPGFAIHSDCGRLNGKRSNARL